MLSRRAPRSRALKLTALLLVSWCLAALSSPAAAGVTPETRPAAHLTAASSAPVTVEITDITPLSPGPKDTLRVSGRVVNHGTGHLTDVQVTLHLGRSVASRTELHDLRASPVEQVSATAPQLAGDGKLDPGRSLTFTISIPISRLPLPFAGVYPMQVLATGVPGPNQAPVDLFRASTFLPYIPDAEATPATPLAWVVPLTASPSLLADGTFDGNGLLAAVAPGGRLRNLLDSLGEARAATATVDPAVIEALSVAASGRYLVSGSSVLPKSVPASTSARSWLDELRAADTTSLIGLPYANVDVDALLHANQRGMAEDARSRGAAVLSLGLLDANRRVTSAVAAPAGGAVDATAAAYYRTNHAHALILDSGAVPATGDNPSAVAAVPGISARLLLSDRALTDLVTADPASNTRMAEQDIIAELAEAHLEDRFIASPAQGSTGTAARAATASQPILIAPPAGWSPTAAWASRLLGDTAQLPWLKQVPVTSLLAATPEPRARLLYSSTQLSQELPTSLVDGNADIAAAAAGLFRQPLKGEAAQPRTPESIIRPIRDATLAAVSSDWRSDPTQAAPFEQSAERVLAGLQQGVRVVASPQVTLTSRSGKVPVTLENDLGAAVDVSLVLTSLDKSRVTSGTTVRRTVRAGQKVQVEVEVHAASAGTFPIRLTLFSPDGRPLGTPAQVLVRSTTYGVVATIFTVVALSVLGLAVVIRAIRALSRRIRRSHQPPPDVPVGSAAVR